MRNATTNSLLAIVRRTIEAHSLLPAAGGRRAGRQTLVVGVSGGPDSVAMLLVLKALARTELAVRLVVAHLNHRLRGRAADEDQAFVERLARRLRCPCVSGAADVKALARRRAIGIEEAGRQARRKFLLQVARRCHASRVALGHTADDRAETVLFNVLRGTGIDGLAAMGPRTVLHPGAGDRPARGPVVEIIRPLISATRHQVLDYLAAEGQPCRHDETNFSSAYTRNRLRYDVLPLIREKINPRVNDALVRLAEQAAAAGDVLGDAVDAVWRQMVRAVPAASARERPPRRDAGQPADLIVDADDFAGLRPWMQGAILRRAVEQLGGGLKHMSAERTIEVVRAVTSKSLAGPVSLPGGLVICRRRRAIRIGRGTAT